MHESFFFLTARVFFTARRSMGVVNRVYGMESPTDGGEAAGSAPPGSTDQYVIDPLLGMPMGPIAYNPFRRCLHTSMVGSAPYVQHDVQLKWDADVGRFVGVIPLLAGYVPISIPPLAPPSEPAEPPAPPAPKEPEELVKPNNDGDDDDNIDPRLMCCVCMNAEKEYALDPCGHVLWCETCYTKSDLAAGCPLCRIPVTKAIRVYI